MRAGPRSREVQRVRRSRVALAVHLLWILGMIGFFLGPNRDLSGKEKQGWTKHVIYTGFNSATAVASDFTGDGKIDVITNSGRNTRLLVGPHWNEVIIDDTAERNCIHSDILDVDGDGDPDYIAARYSPGLIFWLERPQYPLSDPWPYHLIDDRIDGVHGLLVGELDGEGKAELLATSAQPQGAFPNSLVWYRVPPHPRSAERWERHVFADRDASGLSHYLGLGDVNGDGRPDVASAAKGGPTATPGSGEWFAWWEAPANPERVWIKHVLSDQEPGATNIHPADVNADGRLDFVASRGHGQGVFWLEAPQWTIHEIHPTLKGPHCLVVADLDEDGDPDAATCAKDDQVAIWFENDGRGHFKSHRVGQDQKAYDIRAVDMDQDGDLDLLIGGYESNNVVWYENPHPG